MSHNDFRGPVHGGLEGSLPNKVRVKGESVHLDISRQVYGPKVAGGQGKKGNTGLNGAAGQGRPPGAYWVTPGGGLILVPVNSVEVFINGPCTIQAVRVATKGGTGSCRLTFWRSNFISGHYPPIVTDDLTGGNDVIITSGTTYADATLTGWSTSLATDDCILIGLPSCANFTSVAVALRVG